MARVPGPLQTMTGPTGMVVASTPWMLNSSVHTASTRGDHPRQVLGLAAGHHGVDRDLLDRHRHQVGRHDGDHLVRVAVVPCEHAQHPLLGGRHHRQAVGEAAVEHRLHLVVEIGELDAARLQHVAAERGRAARRPDRGRRYIEPQPGSHDGQVVAEVVRCR